MSLNKNLAMDLQLQINAHIFIFPMYYWQKPPVMVEKMYELMGKLKPMHVMNLPQTSKGEDALEMWKNEMVKFKEFLEKN